MTPNDILGRISATMFTAEAAATLACAVTGPAVAHAFSTASAAYFSAVVTVLSTALAVAVLPETMH